jgi:hypothetical protein
MKGRFLCFCDESSGRAVGAVGNSFATVAFVTRTQNVYLPDMATGNLDQPGIFSYRFDFKLLVNGMGRTEFMAVQPSHAS